ncbi:MAG: YdcF family protein [Bacteroidales bacterium]|nr:YdcF family protein [Bacteroidales bacterium]
MDYPVVSTILKQVKRAFGLFLRLLGWFSLIAIVLSFTDIPWYAYYWLGTKGAGLTKKPHYIVMLGGVGMPSPDDLMRTWFAAGAAHEVPESDVIVSFPPDTACGIYSPELLMARELVMRGIDSSRISFEKQGYSTRSQALKIMDMLNTNRPDTISMRIVTSPEHMFRAIRVFRKAGFGYVGGTPAFESSIDENKLIKGKFKKTEKRFLNIRYNMWSYLKYEITVIREFCAIAYYKLRGWI